MMIHTNFWIGLALITVTTVSYIAAAWFSVRKNDKKGIDKV